MVDVRKGQYRGRLSCDAFRAHFIRPFYDPAFEQEKDAITRLEVIAWDAYSERRKAPRQK